MNLIKIGLASSILFSGYAHARTHTMAERDSTITLCKSLAALRGDAYLQGLKNIQDTPTLGAEDKNYIMDMCFAFNQGQSYEVKVRLAPKN